VTACFLDCRITRRRRTSRYRLTTKTSLRQFGYDGSFGVVILCTYLRLAVVFHSQFTFASSFGIAIH
jgi:hypothetical protein